MCQLPKPNDDDVNEADIKEAKSLLGLSLSSYPFFFLSYYLETFHRADSLSKSVI